MVTSALQQVLYLLSSSSTIDYSLGLWLMDLMQNYSKLFKIINFKGAGGPMFKTCQCAPYIAVMIISEFEPHSRFHS